MGFITKDDQQRIDETLQFIAASTLVPTQMRTAVAAFVTAFLNQRLPPGTTRRDLRTFSRQMSMARVPHSGTEVQRNLRRAIHLLWEAMGNHQRAEEAKTCPGGDLVHDYKRSMEKAWLVSETRGGGNVGHQWVFTHGLRHHTRAFLTRNRITIRGSPRIRTDDGDRNVLDFNFSFDPLYDRYAFGVGGVGGMTFQTVSVPAVHWATVPGRGNAQDAGSFANVHGTELGGATVMLTTQFTGCSFCIKDAGRVLAAHISPSLPSQPHSMDGTKLARQLSGQQGGVTGGDFGNGAGGSPFLVFGRGYSNFGDHGGYDARIQGGGTSSMSVIGFLRSTGQWKVYSQQVLDGRIVKAVRIFPA